LIVSLLVTEIPESDKKMSIVLDTLKFPAGSGLQRLIF
jgi:hypothetical protein